MFVETFFQNRCNFIMEKYENHKYDYSKNAQLDKKAFLLKISKSVKISALCV